MIAFWPGRLVLVGSLLAGPPAVAAHLDPSTTPTVTVTGEAILSLAPDEAEIELGVVTTARDAASAGARNARQVRDVIEALRAALGPDATVETVAYTVGPDRRDDKDADERAITGYTASNMVLVTLHDLSRVGDVIDAALKAGANGVRRLAFTLRDEEAASGLALRKAAANARARAAAIAGALGVELGALVSATSGARHVPRRLEAAMIINGRASAATPILPGPIEVRAAATLTMAVHDTARGRAPR